MIVRILSQGKSFKGLATYLTHDADAKSTERVGWTHTLNLAQDHVASAVDEMLWTARHAELLKQQAGIRAGGRATENAVKHVSLNWSPEEKPTREHMVETAEHFLRYMNWHEHQTLVVNHLDKPHAHVHLMINTVHAETGLRLDDNFEQRRAQKWALSYEQENGRVFCEQRLENIGERERSPTRPAWMAFQKKQIEFERDENARRDQGGIFWEQPENPRDANSAAWKELKEMQRQERLTFFAEGKLEFSELRRSIYHDVREEFRDRWADFYSLQKNGTDATSIADLKKGLIAEQTEVLEKRRDEACTELRDSRNTRYRELLEDQRGTRLQMRWRQESGLDNAIFLRVIGEKKADDERHVPTFRDAAAETAKRPAADRCHERGAFVAQKNARASFKSGPDIGDGIASGLGFGLLSFIVGLAGLTGSAPEPKPREADQVERTDPFDGAFEAAKKRQLAELEEEDYERRRNQRSYGD